MVCKVVLIRRVSPRILACLLAVACACLAACQNPVVGKFTQARNAKISRGPANGDVPFVDAAVGQPVREGFAVRTQRRSFAEITFIDGSALRVNEETDLIVQSAKTLRRIRLDRGEVWVRDENGSRTAVQTPVATATARGTEFTVDANGIVKVTEGEVELEAHGTTIVLGPGETGGVGPSGQPTKLGANATPNSGKDDWYNKPQPLPPGGLDLGGIAAMGAVGSEFGTGGRGPKPKEATPEPATLFAVGAGLAGWAARRRAKS